MSEAPGTPEREDAPLRRPLAEVAGQPVEDTLDDERRAVGDQPDSGGLVPPDQAQ